MKYATIARYLDADHGVPNVRTLAPRTLRRTIQAAESMIDSFCGFDTRLGGFEWHAAWWQAPFDERTLKIRIPNYPVPIRNITRYRIQISNLSSGSATGFFADIMPSDCAISVWGGYVEIVPLQAVTYSLAPVVMGMGLRPPLVQIDYNAGFVLPAYGEVLEEQDNAQTTYVAQHGHWATTYDLVSFLQPNLAPPTTPVVYVNNVAQASNAYTLDTTEGTVTFNTPQTGHPTVTLDYAYTIPDPIEQATYYQVTYLLNQRAITDMGLGGLEVGRSRDQQIKRHIRTSAADSVKDEPALDPYAMQLLEPYRTVPIE